MRRCPPPLKARTFCAPSFRSWTGPESDTAPSEDNLGLGDRRSVNSDSHEDLVVGHVDANASPRHAIGNESVDDLLRPFHALGFHGIHHGPQTLLGDCHTGSYVDA
jgi:hypothetical protein